MPIILVNFILWYIPVITNNIIISFCFETKNRCISKMRCVFELCFMQTPLVVLKFLLNDSITLRNIIILITIVTLLVYMHFRFVGQLWKKMLFVAFYYLCNFLAEMLVQVLMYQRINELFVQNPYDKILMTYYLLYLYALATIFLIIFLFIWRKINSRMSYSYKAFIVFIIFPTSQIFMIASINSGIFEFDTPRGTFALLGIGIGLIADVLLLYTLLRQQSMQEMTLRLNAIHKAWDVEQSHYQEIEARREELAKIRHDLNEQFVVMKELLHNKNYDIAMEMLDALNEYVASTKEYAYCGDPVVNAIMAENEKFCMEHNIDFIYDLQILQSLRLEPVTICSIFSNLLRNAIAGARCVEQEYKYISVKASVSGDYLHIKVENSFMAGNQNRDKERKGYGLLILKSFAEKLNGYIEINNDKDIFTVIMSVENI